MATGIVKWFNNQKGYGFICPSEDEHCPTEEVFAHFSSIIMKKEGEYKSLRAGQKVNFEINQGPKGLYAMNIRPEDDERQMKESRSLPPQTTEIESNRTEKA